MRLRLSTVIGLIATSLTVFVRPQRRPMPSSIIQNFVESLMKMKPETVAKLKAATGRT